MPGENDPREHAVLEQRLTTLEREMGEVRRRHQDDTLAWESFLKDFGALRARVEGLAGRLAGYVLAGSVLAGGLALVAQFIIRR